MVHARIWPINRGPRQRVYSTDMSLYSRYILPRLLDFSMSQPQLMRERPRALADASGDVLEIGFGTGLNLSCYPAGIRSLTALEPANVLPRRVAQRLAAAAMPVTIARGDATELPFDAGRFDCVVSTWTLCTIPAVEAALAEVRRVLNPSGRFLFLEHGRSQEPRVAWWQDRLDRVHGLFSGGCHVNRPIDSLVAASGLTIQRLERFDLPRTARYMAPHFLGVATVA
jgi:SAM-dependent methyltransferase